MNKGSLIVESLLLEIKYFLSPKIISFVRNVIFLIQFFQGKKSQCLINSQIILNFRIIKMWKQKKYHNWNYQILVELSNINILFSYFFLDSKIRGLAYVDQTSTNPIIYYWLISSFRDTFYSICHILLPNFNQIIFP